MAEAKILSRITAIIDGETIAAKEVTYSKGHSKIEYVTVTTGKRTTTHASHDFTDARSKVVVSIPVTKANLELIDVWQGKEDGVTIGLSLEEGAVQLVFKEMRIIEDIEFKTSEQTVDLTFEGASIAA